MSLTNTATRCYSVARKVVFYVVLLLTGTRGTDIKVSNFDMVAADRLVSKPISTSVRSSEVGCCGECQKNDDCHSLSYHRANGKCVLSDYPWQMTHNSTGWQTFTRRYGCPFAGSDTYFHRVGNQTGLAVCPSKPSDIGKMTTTQSDAWSACRQFGNLLKLETAEKMAIVKQFLQRISPREASYWVDGRMNATSHTWMFTDGTPMPSGRFNWTQVVQTVSHDSCAEISTRGGYQLMTAPCNKHSGYICEKTWP